MSNVVVGAASSAGSAGGVMVGVDDGTDADKRVVAKG